MGNGFKRGFERRFLVNMRPVRVENVIAEIFFFIGFFYYGKSRNSGTIHFNVYLTVVEKFIPCYALI